MPVSQPWSSGLAALHVVHVFSLQHTWFKEMGQLFKLCRRPMKTHSFESGKRGKHAGRCAFRTGVGKLCCRCLKWRVKCKYRTQKIKLLFIFTSLFVTTITEDVRISRNNRTERNEEKSWSTHNPSSLYIFTHVGNLIKFVKYVLSGGWTTLTRKATFQKEISLKVERDPT